MAVPSIPGAQQDVIAAYDLSKEHIQEQNYKIELSS